MAGSINKAIILGHLGQDPKVISTQDGRKIVTLSVATSERWTDKGTGEKREKTEWHRVSIFNERLAEVAEKYLRKGSPVYLEGQIQTRKWADQGGAERYSTEIVLSAFRGELVLLGSQERGSGQEPTGGQAYSRGARDRYKGTKTDDELDDEIPF